MRIRPGFLLGLFIVFVIIPCVVSLFLPTFGGPGSAGRARTRREVIAINVALRQRGFGWLDTQFQLGLDQSIPAAFFGSTNRGILIHASKTNLNGELLDHWRTPYRIKVNIQTNYVIRSAGQNRKFGDKDDIVFDSLKNDFVKP